MSDAGALAARVAEFRARGFVVLPGVLSAEEVRAAIAAIVDAGRRLPAASPLTRGAMEFYSNCFRHSPALHALVARRELTDLVTALADDDVWLRWDQCVAKGPGAPEFPWHQDNAYNSLKDEHFQVWVALSAMTPENGGVWFAPGSHLRGRLAHIREGTHYRYTGEVEAPVFVAAQPGDVVCFSSLLLHKTDPNTTDAARWAYVLEYMRQRDFDPALDPPYLCVTRDRAPSLEWRAWTPGRRALRGWLQYPRWRAERLVKRLRGR
ncbi:MAG: phytanoyl-CoA dioxygenase family protein [Planctomycetota bacterium]